MISVLYTDAQIVVCVNPSGILSQDSGENSLPQQLCRQLNVEVLYVVHRLDKEVGGVMVYARTKAAAAALSRAVQEHRLEKIYLAVLRGIPEVPQAVLEDLLFHDKMKNKTYVVKRARKGVKDARLDYTVLETVEERSLVQVHLHTGRTHQIRVQFASRKMPLVGDGKYGGKESGCALGLWAKQLSFPHPKTGEMMTFSALPEKEKPWSEFIAVQ